MENSKLGTRRGPDGPQSSSPAISLRGIFKAYGRVQALSDVELVAGKGEVVALVGDNGAGKSTLIKIIAGTHRPDEGSLYLNGSKVQFSDPRDAQLAGISTVFQHLALIEALDVSRNMFLGQEPRRLGFVDRRRMLRESAEVFTGLKIKLPGMGTNVGMLSGGQRQGVAIARAVLQGGEIIVMDEPTAALGVRETGQVLEIVRELRGRQKTIILVTHNLELVFSVADRIEVLRLGRNAGTVIAAKSSRQEVVSLITGGNTAVGSAE